MPSERFIEALNEQIGREFAAAHQYVAIGAFYEGQTFPQLARFFYEQADDRYERHWYWAEQLLGVKPLQRKPSEYLREHCFWGFQKDRAGVELRHFVGADRLLWASDFPHQESWWPNSKGTWIPASCRRPTPRRCPTRPVQRQRPRPRAGPSLQGT